MCQIELCTSHLQPGQFKGARSAEPTADGCMAVTMMQNSRRLPASRCWSSDVARLARLLRDYWFKPASVGLCWLTPTIWPPTTRRVTCWGIILSAVIRLLHWQRPCAEIFHTSVKSWKCEIGSNV